MSKNIKVLLFIIIGIILLYITKINYSDHSINKSILACVIAQKQKSKNITSDEAKKYCEKEIKKNL